MDVFRAAGQFLQPSLALFLGKLASRLPSSLSYIVWLHSAFELRGVELTSRRAIFLFFFHCRTGQFFSFLKDI